MGIIDRRDTLKKYRQPIEALSSAFPRTGCQMRPTSWLVDYGGHYYAFGAAQNLVYYFWPFSERYRFCGGINKMEFAHDGNPYADHSLLPGKLKGRASTIDSFLLKTEAEDELGNRANFDDEVTIAWDVINKAMRVFTKAGAKILERKEVSISAFKMGTIHYTKLELDLPLGTLGCLILKESRKRV